MCFGSLKKIGLKIFSILAVLTFFFGTIFGDSPDFASNLKIDLIGRSGTNLADLKIVASHSISNNVVTISFDYSAGESLNDKIIDGISFNLLFDPSLNAQLPLVTNVGVGKVFDTPTFVDLRGGRNSNVTFYDLGIAKGRTGKIFDFSYTLGEFVEHDISISAQTLTSNGEVSDLIPLIYRVNRVSNVSSPTASGGGGGGSSGGGGGSGGGGSGPTVSTGSPAAVTTTKIPSTVIKKSSCNSMFTANKVDLIKTSSTDQPLSTEPKNSNTTSKPISFSSSLYADIFNYDATGTYKSTDTYNSSGTTAPIYPVPTYPATTDTYRSTDTYNSSGTTAPIYPPPDATGTYPKVYDDLYHNLQNGGSTTDPNKVIGPMPPAYQPPNGIMDQKYDPSTMPPAYRPPNEITGPKNHPVTMPQNYVEPYSVPQYYQPHKESMKFKINEKSKNQDKLENNIKSLIRLSEIFKQFENLKREQFVSKNSEIEQAVVMQDNDSKSFYCLDEGVKLEVKDDKGKKLQNVTFVPPKIVTAMQNNSPPEKKSFASDVYEVGIGSGVKVDFNADIGVFLPLRSNIVLKSDSNLAAYSLDEKTGKWNYEAPCDLNVVDEVVMCDFKVKHMTKFAIFEDAKIKEVEAEKISLEDPKVPEVEEPPEDDDGFMCHDVKYDIGMTDFTDIENHYAQEAITILYQRKIVNGYENNKFKPDQNITRAEFLKMVMKTLNCDLMEKAPYKPFKDVKIEAWYAPYIFMAKFSGIVGGYGNGEFRPEKNINRAEALKILLYAAKIELIEETAQTFPDVAIDSWYASIVKTAYNMNVIQGYADGKFGPDDLLTRGQSALMITNMDCNNEVQCR